MELLLYLTALFLAVENAAALERNLAFEKKVKATAPTARRALVVVKRELPLSNPNSIEEGYQCGADHVSEWIDQELQPKTCADLPLGPLCQQYESTQDVNDCPTSTPESMNLALTGGGMASSREECEFFFAALQPNPYFRDVDSLNHVFGTTGSFPTRHECYEMQDEMCQFHVVYDVDTNFTGETPAPTPAPYTLTVPCTRCDFYYQDDETCFNADCNLFQCAENNQTDSNQETPEAPPNHSQNQVTAEYLKLNHDNSTSMSCPTLNHGEVDCQSCLEAGCAAVEGQCLVSCFLVPDSVCWSHEFFYYNTSEEVCHLMAKVEADDDICGRYSLGASRCVTITVLFVPSQCFDYSKPRAYWRAASNRRLTSRL